MSYFGIPIRNGLPIGLGSLTALAAAINSIFSPSSLFAAGEQGVWYDPSDLTTLFQDSAGTTPVTAVEQPVGKMLDKSGRGNHATQATPTKRPLLSARYNLLTSTEDLTNNSVWEKTLTTVNTVTTATISAGGRLAQYFGANVLAYTSIILLSGTGTVAVTLMTNGYAIVATQTITLSSTPQKVILSGTPPGGSTLIGIFIASAAGASVAVGGASLVPADQASLPYQRVNTATDYNAVGFKPYLKFDGIDDALSTGSIDFTATDKMTVWSGVRKLSDAAVGVATELSVSSGINNGAFALFAPSAAGSAQYSFRSRGTSSSEVTSALAYASPNTSVLTALGGISTDQNSLSVTPGTTTISATAQGTGNYGNYPLYIGSRAGTSLPFNGQLYSLIVRGAQSTTPQITSTETYVNGKTGAY